MWEKLNELPDKDRLFIVAFSITWVIVAFFMTVNFVYIFLFYKRLMKFCKATNKTMREFLYIDGFFWRRGLLEMAERIKKTEVTTPEAERAKKILLEFIPKIITFFLTTMGVIMIAITLLFVMAEFFFGVLDKINLNI